MGAKVLAGAVWVKCHGLADCWECIWGTIAARCSGCISNDEHQLVGQLQKARVYANCVCVPGTVVHHPAAVDTAVDTAAASLVCSRATPQASAADQQHSKQARQQR